MGTNTNKGLVMKGEWLELNKEDLINSINETEEKLTEEIRRKKEEREIIRLMRDMINTLE